MSGERQTETHQAETTRLVCPCGAMKREVVPVGALIDARADLQATEARVAELEAERDDWKTRAASRLEEINEAADRIDRAVAERTAEIVAALRRAQNRGSGVTWGDWAIAVIERKFPAPTRTREASDGD